MPETASKRAPGPVGWVVRLQLIADPSFRSAANGRKLI